jgi:V8-like Glu-specific endopeptidase
MTNRSFVFRSAFALIPVSLGIGACSTGGDPNAVTDSSGLSYPLARDNAGAILNLNPADYPDMPLERLTKPRKAKDPNAPVDMPAFDLKTRQLVPSALVDRPAAPMQRGQGNSLQGRASDLNSAPADSAPRARTAREPGVSSFQNGATSESDIEKLPRAPGAFVDRLPDAVNNGDAVDELESWRGLMLKRDFERMGVDPTGVEALKELAVKEIAAISVRTDSTLWPERSNVRLFITWPNGSTNSCSGKLIGLRTLLTAGHCLFKSSKGGDAASVRVVPGLDDTYMPFGDAFINRTRVASNWRAEEDNDDDWAMAFIDRDLGAVTGHFGVLPASIDSLDNGIHSAAWGYPDTHGGEQLVRATGTTDCADTWMIYHDLPLSAGFSGSGHHPQSGSNNEKLFGIAASIGNFNALCGETSSPASTRINNTRHGFIRDFNDETPPGFMGSQAGWTPLGGLGNAGMTAVSWGPDRNDIFIRGLTNAAHHKAQIGSSFFPVNGGWDFNGGAMFGKIGVTSRAVNVFDMFIRANGTPGPICTKSWVNAWVPSVDGWTCFADTLAKGSPAATNTGSDRLHVLFRADNNHVIEKAWTGAGGWAATVDLGGSTIHDVAVESRTPLVWDAFIRNSGNGQLCTKSRSNTTLWPAGTGWFCFAGAFAFSEPTVVSSGANNLDVFFVGTDNGIWHMSFRGAAGWTGPHSLGGLTRMPIAAVSRSANQVDIFVVGLDGAIYTKANNGTAWWPSQTGWAGLGGDMLDVVATSWGPSRIDLFARDRSLQPRHRFWNGSAWSN